MLTDRGRILEPFPGILTGTEAGMMNDALHASAEVDEPSGAVGPLEVDRSRASTIASY